MVRGPKGERRPADVVECAVTVAKIATGEMEESTLKYPGRHASGVAGGKARRKEIAKKAAEARWSQ